MFIEKGHQRHEISDREIAGILSAIGTNEERTVLYLSMYPRTVYFGANIYHGFLEVQGQNPFGCPQSLPYNTLRDNFHPNGFAEAVRVEEGGAIGFRQLDAGGIAVATAGFLGDFSERHPDNALGDFWGPRASPKRDTSEGEVRESPTYRRLMILRRLRHTRLPITDISLIRMLGVPTSLSATISRHLQGLDGRDIIIHKSIKPEGEYSRYGLRNSSHNLDPIGHSDDQLLNDRIVELFPALEQGFYTIEQIIEALKDIGYYSQEAALYRRVSRVLGNLATQGYLTSKNFSFRRRSMIRLTDAQKEQLAELIDGLTALQNRSTDMISQGRLAAAELLSNPKRIRALVEKGRLSSPDYRRTDPEKIERLICRAVELRPGITTRELTKVIRQKIGPFSHNFVYKSAQTLKGKKRVESGKRGRQLAWYLSE